MTVDIFDRIGALVQEIAASTEKTAMDDPGQQDGKSTHPTAKVDDPTDVGDPPTGEQAADNEAVSKRQNPASPDNSADATPSSAPKAEDAQLGDAKSTGKDPASEKDYKGTKDDGETSHPASGDFGEKYASERLETLPDEELYKLAVELGNELAADIANGLTAEKQAEAAVEAPAEPATDGEAPAEQPTVDANDAAMAGYKTAAAAGQVSDENGAAAAVIAEIVKTASAQADLVAEYLQSQAAELAKAAAEDEEKATPEAAGDDSEAAPAADDAVPTPQETAPGDAELLAAMSGGGGAPEEAAAIGAEAGAEPMAPEGDIDDEQALQELAMALEELGVDPEQLAAMAAEAPGAAKLAADIRQFKLSGKFRLEEAKTAEARELRDWMKERLLSLFAGK